MAQYDKIIETTSEALLEDERLRSNLKDAEAKIIIDWALAWLDERIRASSDPNNAKQIANSERARLRQMLGTLNLVAKNEKLKLGDVVSALEPSLGQNTEFKREEIFILVTQLADRAWKMRAAG